MYYQPTLLLSFCRSGCIMHCFEVAIECFILHLHQYPTNPPWNCRESYIQSPHSVLLDWTSAFSAAIRTREVSLRFHYWPPGVEKWYSLSFVAVRSISWARLVMFGFLLSDFLFLKQSFPPSERFSQRSIAGTCRFKKQWRSDCTTFCKCCFSLYTRSRSDFATDACRLRFQAPGGGVGLDFNPSPSKENINQLKGALFSPSVLLELG